MGLIVQDMSGNTYNLGEIGIKTEPLIIHSPSFTHYTETIEGRHGIINIDSLLGERDLSAKFLLIGTDKSDISLLRDEFFKLLDGRQFLYLIESTQRGRRWKVKTARGYKIDVDIVTEKTGEVEVDFVSFTPFAESVGTTQDEFTFDSELWQVGQGLPVTDGLIYTHSSTSFSIFNAGDVEIDPRELPLVIEYKGAANNLEINNLTTGDTWSYTGTSIADDVIKIDGIRSTKNDLSVFGATNKKLITLAPGWNEFTLNGTGEGFEIKFDFRFYYL